MTALTTRAARSLVVLACVGNPGAPALASDTGLGSGAATRSLTDARVAMLSEAASSSGASSGMLYGASSRPGGWLVDQDDVSLRAMGQIQFRYVLSAREDQPVDENDFTHGFESTRTRLGVMGHVVDRSVTYFVWGGWNASGSNFLLDAWDVRGEPLYSIPPRGFMAGLSRG